MIESGLCFLPYQTEENGEIYLTIAVQAKDADAFLKVQENVFNSKNPSKKEEFILSTDISVDEDESEEVEK